MKTLVFLLLLVGCEDAQGRSPERAAVDRQRERDWNEVCHDEATLVATTSGSPNSHECPNRMHKMRVTVATKAGEEIGAVVFCECERDAGAAGARS